MKLTTDFYLQENVLQISEELLGKVLFTKINGKICSGMIVETEAYMGITDKASHAYGGRFTERTKTMYEKGGIAYVYLCYGIHHLFNIVTNAKTIPHAVLIRAIEPLEGIDMMLKRRKKQQLEYTLTSGPGSLSEAMGIHYSHSGISLIKDQIWIEDQGIKIKQENIIASPRVGVAYAKEDALLPYRFRIKDNPWTSKAK